MAEDEFIRRLTALLREYEGSNGGGVCTVVVSPIGLEHAVEWDGEKFVPLARKAP